MEPSQLLRGEDRPAIEAWCRRNTQAVPVGNGEVLCRVLGKYMMYVSERDLSLTPHLMLDGFWEMWISMAVARHLKPGMHCIDVGANVGYFTLLMADLVGPGGSVQAWEPNPLLASLLRRSLAVNGYQDRVQVIEAAALRAPANQVALCVPGDCLGSAEITTIIGSGILVRGSSLNAEEDFDRSVDFVKVDAEGSEPDVWEGASSIRSRCQDATWLVEFSPDKYTDPHGFVFELGSEGRRIRIVDENGLLRPFPAQGIANSGFEMLWIDRPPSRP